MDIEKRETALAEQYLEWLDQKVKPKQAFQKIQKMGFKGCRRTMDRHIASIRRTGHALSVVQKDRSRPSLNVEQMSKVNDWILVQNTNNRPIGYRDVQKFINDKFRVRVHERTAGNILHRLGHSLKTCQTRTAGFKKTTEELETEYMQFITKMKKEGRFCRLPGDIRSIDVTYTSRPKGRRTTFSPIGGGKQRADTKTNQYTNAIVTMISGDGLNHTPCLLFTHDPKMAKTQKNTVRGKRIRSEFEAALKSCDIKEDRIIYVKDKQHLFGESPDVYEHFLNRYTIPKNTLILHDGGNAFKRKGTSIFDNLGFTNHVTYPADVHQFLSPNDNKLHGCKATWKKEYPDFSSEVSSSLRLMQLIDLDTVKNSQTYFQRNLFTVTRGDLHEVMRK